MNRDKKPPVCEAVCKEPRETRDQLQNQFKEPAQDLKDQKRSIKGYIAIGFAATNRE